MVRVVVRRIRVQRCIGCLRLCIAGCLTMMMLGGSVLVMVVAIGMLVVVMVVRVMAYAGRCSSEHRSWVVQL